VVLMPGGTEVNAPLLKALAGRGLPPVVVSDEPGVMSELAKLSQRRAQRRVLVIVEPERWARLGELVCAVQSHHSRVHCWHYAERGEGAPLLTHLDQRFAGPTATADAKSQVIEDDETEPLGQITRRRRTVDRLLVKAPGREMSAREIVTQQELTMLLGPAPGEAG